MLPYAIVLRLHTFIWPERYFYVYEGNNYLYKWIYTLVSTPISQSIVAVLLIYMHAIVLNQISIKHRLGRTYTLFPGVIYILLVSMHSEVIYLSPGLIATTALLFMITQMFMTYKNHNATIYIFNAGFFGALAFLLSPQLLFFYLFGYVGLMILRSFKRTEIFQYSVGYLAPIFLSISLLYYFQVDLSNVAGQFFSEIGWISMSVPAGIKTYIFISVILLLFIVSFFSYNRYTLRKSIQEQKKIDLIFWLGLFALVVTLFCNVISFTGVIILIAAIALLFSMNISWITNKLYSELIHLILLAILIYNFYI